MRKKDHPLLLASRETVSGPEVAGTLSVTIVPETARHAGRRALTGEHRTLRYWACFSFPLLGGPSVRFTHWI